MRRSRVPCRSSIESLSMSSPRRSLECADRPIERQGEKGISVRAVALRRRRAFVLRTARRYGTVDNTGLSLEGAMRQLAFVILAATTLLVPPSVADAQRATLERITHHDTLANGLEVIVVENHSVPLATVEVVVRAGAMIQEEEDQGVPHLFEHMLFTGYRGAGDRDFRQTTSELHAAYNGTTSDETVA